MENNNIKLRLILDIDYKPNDENLETLRRLVNRMPSLLAGNGMMTGETSAEINGWSYSIKKIK